MNPLQLTREEESKLLEIAESMLPKAYAVYSKFRVGAAVLTEKGNIFPGCNVENVSYGLTICAERNAIAAAVAAEGGDKMKIKALAVVNAQNISCSPCGACRQVIWEFGRKAVVIFQGDRGKQTLSIEQLLPSGFSW
ncbi:MAG: cytidine deaminase [Xenococcaceae cyanobacterium MO_188.B32]|nr:cytidine deaminase [Xenococcaceae cyanobacterium MO_188.B32]